MPNLANVPVAVSEVGAVFGESWADVRSGRAQVMPWRPLGNGLAWLLSEPSRNQVDFRVLANGLAQLPRWGGLTCDAPYSYAQHSLMVAANLPPDIRSWGLLGHAHMVFLGDLTSVMGVMSAAGADGLDQFFMNYQGLVSATQGAIRTAAGLPLEISTEGRAEIAQAVLDVTLAEAQYLLAGRAASAKIAELRALGARPLKLTQPIRSRPWMDAADDWLTEARRLLPGVRF